jgi:hypothetical protein
MKYMNKKCLKCENTAWTKGLCRNHYWSKLYNENRLPSRRKYEIETIYFDSNMNRRASPEFELLCNGSH